VNTIIVYECLDHWLLLEEELNMISVRPNVSLKIPSMTGKLLTCRTLCYDSESCHPVLGGYNIIGSSTYIRVIHSWKEETEYLKDVLRSPSFHPLSNNFYQSFVDVHGSSGERYATGWIQF
jgi:hypothetical protein